MNDQSPPSSGVETVDQAADYLRWLRRKVAAARADGRPSVEHSEAMMQVRAIIEAKAPKD